MSKRHCKKNVPASMKPAKKRKCPKKLCGFASCQDVKKKGASKGDGEYEILLGGRNISVFCHQMSSNWPKEYLSLPKGEQENYSEVYGMRLLSPNSCPNNGSREPDCPCVKDDSPRAGMTVWSKIQLNITALSVNSYDFTFARKLHGEVVPYGEAGDCYSTANCPQVDKQSSYLDINLNLTKLPAGEVLDQPDGDGAASCCLHRLDWGRK